MMEPRTRATICRTTNVRAGVKVRALSRRLFRHALAFVSRLGGARCVAFRYLASRCPDCRVLDSALHGATSINAAAVVSGEDTLLYVTKAGELASDLLYLAPGVSARLSAGFSAYGYVQFPVYQDVDGVQLTPKEIYSVGIRKTF
jgi:hypothetical protein